MALVHRIVHLSKLAFFLSLGVAATIVDACGGEEESGTSGKQPKGGATSTGQAGATATGGTSQGSAHLGGSAPTSTGGTSATGGTTGIVVDAGPPPKDAELWDVICE